MKVLVATQELQGHRKNDFSHTQDGEIVRFQFECDGEKIDGTCGCRRSMAGTESARSTTTMKVVDMVITKELFQAKIEASLCKDGWITDEMPDGQTWAKEEAEELLRVAARFKVGTIIEQRGVYLRARKTKLPLAG